MAFPRLSFKFVLIATSVTELAVQSQARGTRDGASLRSDARQSRDQPFADTGSSCNFTQVSSMSHFLTRKERTTALLFVRFVRMFDAGDEAEKDHK